MENLAKKITCNFTKHYGYNTYMDIYYPKKPREYDVCVLTLHSGGFYNGARDDELQMQIIEMLVKEGFIVASADYRLGMRDWYKNHRFSLLELSPAFRRCVDLAQQDCGRAIDFLSDKAKELKIGQYRQPRIILAGCSSGAIAALQTEYGISSVWKPPTAVIAFSGSILCDAPLRFVSRPAPMLLVHGLKDKVVRVGSSWIVGSAWTFYGSKCIRKAALKAGGACRAIWLDKAEHEASMAMPKMANEVTEFICDSLRRNYIAESMGCEYSIRFDDVQYGTLDLEEEAKMWRGQTALKLVKENLQNSP